MSIFSYLGFCFPAGMYGYHGKRSLDFLRITMAMPRLIAPAKRLLELGFKFGPFPLQNYQSYEANIDFEIRCVRASTMGHGFEKKCWRQIKTKQGFSPSLSLCHFLSPGLWWTATWSDAVGLNFPKASTRCVRRRTPATTTLGIRARWVCVKQLLFSFLFLVQNNVQNLSATAFAPQVSLCQYEVDVGWTDLISHPAEGEWQRIAPLRVLSFDIECAGRKGDDLLAWDVPYLSEISSLWRKKSKRRVSPSGSRPATGIFPEADKDPVIQIASMVQRQGETEPFIRTVFTLQSCASIVGSQIFCFTQEQKLLQVPTAVCIFHECAFILFRFIFLVTCPTVLCLFTPPWAELGRVFEDCGRRHHHRIQHPKLWLSVLVEQGGCSKGLSKTDSI